MPRILALDLARNCGWAHDSDVPGRPVCGTHRLPKIEGNSIDGYDYGTPWAALWLFVRGKVEAVKPELIVFEAPLMPRPKKKDADQNIRTQEMTVRALFGYATLVETMGVLSGIDVEEANVQTVKKFFAGHGFASKEEMMARCRQLGWTYSDDNSADACAVWAHQKAITEPKFSYATTPLFARARA